MSIYTTTINGLQVTTGDIICTADGEKDSLFGRLWQMLGKLVPGEVDHCLVYSGPGGRCIESGPLGVISFELTGEIWEAASLFSQRWILDTIVGVAYPLADLDLPAGDEEQIRLNVARFCLEQAYRSKPYNLNFFNPEQDGAYYCSQLVYKAYRNEGIDLNTNERVPCGPFDCIVFPQEIWNACQHQPA
jgi:hypothetical protein